jgi:hypothetical protein
MEAPLIIGLGIVSIYLLFRNGEVYRFSDMVSRLAHKWSERHISEICSGKEISAWHWFYRRLPSYGRLLFSFKPLELESFFTKEEINKIFE